MKRYSNLQVRTALKYNLLTNKFVEATNFNGLEVLKVDAEGLRFLSEIAMREISFKLRTSHLEQVAAIFDDDDATENDRRVAYTLIKNASIAVHGYYHFAKTREHSIVFGKRRRRLDKC